MAKQVKEFFQVKIKVKPYIKQYLEINFGAPCKFPSGHFISEYLNVLLTRPTKVENYACKDETAEVIISLPEVTFRRYGFGLTKTNRRNFNLAIENYIKSQIRAIAESVLCMASINEDWRQKYMELEKEHKELLNLSQLPISAETIKKIKRYESIITKRLEEHKKHTIKEKKALYYAAYEVLQIDENLMPFEMIKKDFYRYRISQNT